MYAKVLVLIAITTVVAMLLLAMRQQRVEAMHGMVSQHRQINENRQMLWECRHYQPGYASPGSQANGLGLGAGQYIQATASDDGSSAP
jgi:hypothetical protein